MHAAPIQFDPDDAAFQRDPYPTFRELRSHAPIFFFEPWGKWIVTRHADIDLVLRDRRFGRQRPSALGPASPPGCPHFDRVQSGSLMEIDPPEHTRIRRAVQSAFTSRQVERLAAGVARHAAELVDELEARPARRADLLRDFAQPIPVRVIADLLGIPETERRHLVPWSKAIIALFEPLPSAERAAAGDRAARAFADCIESCLERKSRAPEDDLLSRLARQHHENPESISRGEIVANAVLLLNAGHEAVVGVLGNAVHALLDQEDHLHALRSGTLDWEVAIEELLRFDTPVPLFDRYVHERAEIAGVTLEPNATVALYLGAGNRDERVFDAPDTLRLDRQPNPHLSFGRGAHFCLGAPLARVELAAALPVLLERLPNLRRAPDEEVSFLPGNVFRTLQRLPFAY